MTPAKRWLLFLIWLMMMVAYFDRVVMAIAGPSVRDSLHVSKSEFGFVLSAFTLGYALMQVPGGFLADRFGPRRLLVGALVVWSLFTGITGLAWSLATLLVVRVLFGFGEGIENGAQFKLIGDHFSPRERSMATALFLTSLALGPAIATPAATLLIAEVSWRGTFYCFVVPGLLVAALLFRFLPADGSSSKVADKEASADLKKKPWVPFLTYLLFNIAFWGFLGWIPTYLKEQRHMAAASIGILGAIPFLCGFVGIVTLGRLGSASQFSRRNILLAICYAGAAVSLYFALTASNVNLCIAGLSVAAFFLYGGFGPFWGSSIDRAKPESRGAFTGFVNFGGQIGGFIGQIAIGYLADRMHSFDGAILFMSGSLALASLASMAM